MSTKSQKQIVGGNSRIRKDMAAPEAKGKTSVARSEIEALEEALRDLRGLSAALAEECEEEEEGEGEENEDEEADEEEQIDGVGKKGQKLAKSDSKATKTSEKASPLVVTASSSGTSSSCSSSTQQQDRQHSHRDVSSPPAALSARMSVSGFMFAVLYCVTLLCLQNTNVRVPAPTTATTLHSLQEGKVAGVNPTSPIATTTDIGVDAANGLLHVGQSDTTSTTIRFTVCPVNLLSLPPQVVGAGRNGNANKNNKIVRVLDTTESTEDTKEALRLLPRYLVGLARRYLPFFSRVLLGEVGEAGQWSVAGGGRDELIIVSVPWLEPMTAVAIFCTALVCLFRFILVFADAAVIDATAKRSERMKQKRATGAASSSEGGKKNKKSAARKNEIDSAAAAAEEQSLVAHRVFTLRLVASSLVRCIVAAPLMAAQQALLIVFIIGALNNAAIRFDLTDRMLIMC